MKRIGIFIIAAIGLFLFTPWAQADWTPMKRLTWTSGTSHGPAVAIDSFGHLHLVWTEDFSDKEEIFHKKSTDGGVTWTAWQRISWTPLDSGWPAIAADQSSNLHVFWQDDTPGNREIYYRKFVK